MAAIREPSEAMVMLGGWVVPGRPAAEFNSLPTSAEGECPAQQQRCRQVPALAEQPWHLMGCGGGGLGLSMPSGAAVPPRGEHGTQ